MLRFHRFHVPAAAVRPGTLTLVSFSLFFLVTLTDAMRSLDVSASRDWARLLVRSGSHLTSCLLYLYESYRLAQNTSLSCLRFLLTFLTRLRLCRLDSLPYQFFLRPVFCLTIHTHPTGRYFCLVLLQFLRLLVLVSYRLVYILG